MNQQLNLFYQNQGQREAVRTFITYVLREMAADKAFSGESVSGIKDANDCMVKVFDRLEEEYGKVETTLIPNSR